jgi:hypothetical protein
MEDRMARRVRPSRTEIDRRMRALGLNTKSAQARALDVAPSIHHRALAGEREPNAAYVLGILELVSSDAVRNEIAALFEREPAA